LPNRKVRAIGLCPFALPFSQIREKPWALPIILRPDFLTNVIENTKIGVMGYAVLDDKNDVFMAHWDQTMILDAD
jgi:hypothetical protein